MTNPQQWNAVDEYFSQALVPSDDVLDATLRHSAEAGLPSINVTPAQGKFLHLLAKIKGARRILEIGTLAGYSTIWLGRALPADGQLISLEADAGYAEIARKNIAAAGLANVVSVVVGPAVRTLQKLIAEAAEPFDLVFIDADKQNNPDYLKLALQLSRPGTVIVGDNVVRNGRIADPHNDDPDVTGIREFLALAAATPHLTTTAIQTVGSKGWDGFSLSVVS
ncbi:O-methyltransferase [Paraburkholderia megapolitana]|uniref:Predicted O-methyltransferase YrrM n=1 Tax=Paraburkholderia megapolitana TaxID=420953 RepID=A0A1I3TI99_9BURK|nr:O-methyltransferase [Paraburkholderia megapolitana]QDQ81569.1 O-methyltransferase [Paraburkholderia megapolitana]SFJ69257.1 Predicted O-methyltransferase YrrM [Paraburkholderia megapolitana]